MGIMAAFKFFFLILFFLVLGVGGKGGMMGFIWSADDPAIFDFEHDASPLM